MKLTYLISFLFYSLSTYSQQIKIIKNCQFDVSESFPCRNNICEKNYFDENKIVAKVEYATNGWQILDSFSYEQTRGETCISSYRPIYDLNNRTIKSYKFVNRNCKGKPVFQSSFSDVNDKFNLSYDYLTDLQFLLEQNLAQSNNTFRFKDAIIPTILLKYGIPFNEPLDSFSFSIENNLITNDVFYFENYVLTRVYRYDENALLEVQIAVQSKQNNCAFKFKEYFEIE